MSLAKKLTVKAIAIIVVVVLAGVVSIAVLTTQTGCIYQTSPSGSSHNGAQTYWEKLVGGLCHPLPTG